MHISTPVNRSIGLDRSRSRKKGATLIEKVTGDFFSVVELPQYSLLRALRKFG